MSGIYGFSTKMPLGPSSSGEQEKAHQALADALAQCDDASIERKQSAEDGCVWLEANCPCQMMNYGFVATLERLVAELGRFAVRGFALEYRYEDDPPGVEFFGPTEEAIQEASRQWHCAKAAESLKRAGLDLETLLMARDFAVQIAGLKDEDAWQEPAGGAEWFAARLQGLVTQARNIVRHHR